ncbi:hypothetical protein KR054_001164 [Drosophila jambulina]|nr:hypothetical protein KR054_001164 [Drosophila jambulina]
MSRGPEHKRVSLTSVIQSEAVFSRFGSNFREPEVPAAIANSGNKPAKTAKTIRIKLELFESDSNKYPEFNYSRLLYLEKKKAKKLKQVNTCNGPGSDPFADNDDDVARIVKELEAKYGNSYATGRGKSKKDEYRDIGMGYDESDSFIDNTEAYDEVIPEETETQEGGFFINKGIVTLKSNKKSYTTRTDAIIKMPERSRKRVVSSESSSSSSEEDDDDDDDDNDNDNNDAEGEAEGEEEESDSEDDDEDDESDSEEDDSDSESLDDEDSAATVKSSSKYKDNPAKRSKVIVTGKSKSSSSSSVGSKKLPKKPTVTSSSSNSPRPIVIDNSDTDERHGQIPGPIQSQAQAQAQALRKVVKTTTVKDMLKAKRDSFLKSQSSPAAVKSGVNGELKCISTDVDSSSGSSDTDSATEQGRADKHAAKQAREGPESEYLRSADTLLPASLDADTLSAVNSFKDEVRSRDMCGKKFSLDDKLTPMLLKVYEAVLCTDRNERNMVFSHIEYQLQLPKYYILRKGKAVRAKEEKNKTRKSLEKLRQAVAMVMPKAIANYEVELRNFAEQGAADVNSELPPKMPRKKFQWTSELRQLLYDVYQARWTSYAVLAKRKDSLEEFINGYLKVKVVDLWPSGWMRYDELQHEITRHKNASRKSKEKPKASTAGASSIKPAPALEQLPQASNYPKPVEEPRSRGNSDTDSATSASSNSLKRKLQDQAKATGKPPKKKVAKQVPQQSAQQLPPQPQFQLTPTATAAVVSVPAINNNHLPPHLDTLLSMPSTSAQAAALNAVAGASSASSVLDLASANRKAGKAASSPHNNIIKVISSASVAPNGTPRQSPIGGQTKVIVGARPSAHVINLDDYQCPSEILQTSKQLAATSVITSTSKAAQTTPVTRVSMDSSSESDGVEFVGVYPAWKPTQNALPKPKVKTQRKSLGASPNVGFSNKNMYVYNNNNRGGSLGGAMYDLAAESQIIKAMSDLKALEKTMKWPTQSIFSPSSVKGGAGSAMGSPGTGSSSRQ